jgi:hypothetical protein
MLELPLGVLLYRKRINWKNTNTIAGVVIGTSLIYSLINFFFIQGITGFNSYTNAISSVCFILMAIIYFYFLIQKLPTESITRLPMFWINSAFLIFHSSAFFFFLTADYLIKVLNNNLVAYWLVLHSFRAVYLAMLWRALLLIRAEHKAKAT